MSSDDEMTVIDGSQMEGGGQILRMSVGFSAILNKRIRIVNIRGKRSNPGLRAQHLQGLNLVSDISEGYLVGAAMSSAEIEFSPGGRKKKREGAGQRSQFAADTKTAGATTLLAQAALPCLIVGDRATTLDLKGGTNADMAPSIDFYRRVFLPNLARFFPSSPVECEVRKRGYFPKGGGHVTLNVSPNGVLTPIDLTERGEVTEVRIEVSLTDNLPRKLAHEMAGAAEKVVKRRVKGAKVTVEVKSLTTSEAVPAGSSMLITALTDKGCVLGAQGIGSRKAQPAETGKAAAEELAETLDLGVCVDQYVQDQLVMFMALAKGRSRLRTGPLTLHTETAIHISQVLSGAKFEVTRDGNTNAWVIECQGIGFEKKEL